MANQDLHNTYVERDRVVTTERSGGTALIFGAIVAGLLVLVWLFSMGQDERTVVPAPADSENSVTIDNSGVPATIAPEATAPTAPVANTADDGDDSSATSPAATAPADVTEDPTVPGVPAAPAGN